jgi:hypothetical protein
MWGCEMFIEKLNKKADGSMYVIEEQHVVISGKYEGYLEHDNASLNTIKVFTGSKFTGEEITNVVVSVPNDTPWKRFIKIYANAVKVYITYETHGDTVEANDINQLQEAIQVQQEEFEQYKASGHIRGGTF